MKTATWIGEEDFESWHGNDDDTPANLHEGVPTEISDELAARLATNFPSLVSIDGKTASKPKPVASPEPPVESFPAIGAADFFERWDRTPEAELLIRIASWKTPGADELPVELTRETIQALGEHEEDNGGRTALLDALDELYLATPAPDPSTPAVPAPVKPPAKPTLDELVSGNDRKALNALAGEKGLSEPEKLKDKAAVAEAIVKAW
jgi:hypothetical protein